MTVQRRTLLKAHGLHAGYGGREVLHGIELDVPMGACVALLGPNGAGKSTLLHALAGLLPISDGGVLFDGRRVDRLSVERRVALGMALVPQGRHVFPTFTTRRNLEIGAFTRAGDARVPAEVEALLERFPALGRRADSPAGLLSGGEQQLLVLGRALMARPRLLLLDEPSLGLAPAMVHEVFAHLRALRAEGLTILLVEQNVAAAVRLADEVHTLAAGRLTPVDAAAAHPPGAAAHPQDGLPVDGQRLPMDATALLERVYFGDEGT